MNRGPSRGGVYGARRPGTSFRPVIVLALIAVVVIAIGYFLFRSFFGGGCTDYCRLGEQPDAPQGFEKVSDVFEYQGDAAPADNDVVVALPLSGDPGDGRNLSFYVYQLDTGAWEPGAPASVVDGDKAEGVFPAPPEYVAVLRRTSSAGQVAAYINRDQQLHEEAIARSTIIHPRTYTPQPDGSLAGEPFEIPANDLTAVYPVISAGNAYPGTLPNVEAILADPVVRSAHVQRILEAVNAGNLEGIDIAYVDLRADQRSSFTLFVAELAGQVHAAGKVLTLTLPPPAATADRVDEGAYNWSALGQSADIIKIAPYRDQGTYRLAMPQVLEYLTAVVDPTKLLLAVTPYAAEKTSDGVRALPLAEAMAIATRMAVRSDAHASQPVTIAGVNIDSTENLSGVRWDPSTATVAFSYKDGDAGRTIWLENDFSVGFKLEFINRFALGGVAVEDASDNVYIGDIWRPLAPFFDSGQPLLTQPDSASLAPQWSAPEGEIEAGERGVATWTAPDAPGDYTVFLTLSDGISLFQGELTVQVTVGES